MIANKSETSFQGLKNIFGRQSKEEVSSSKYLDFEKLYDSTHFCLGVAKDLGNEKIVGVKENLEIGKYLKKEKRFLTVEGSEEIGNKILKIIEKTTLLSKMYHRTNQTDQKLKNKEKNKKRKKNIDDLIMEDLVEERINEQIEKRKMESIESFLLFSNRLEYMKLQATKGSNVFKGEEISYSRNIKGKVMVSDKDNDAHTPILVAITCRKLYFIFDRRSVDFTPIMQSKNDHSTHSRILSEDYSDNDSDDYSDDNEDAIIDSESEEEEEQDFQMTKGFQLVKFDGYNNFNGSSKGIGKITNPIDASDLVFLEIRNKKEKKKDKTNQRGLKLNVLQGLKKRKKKEIVLYFKNFRIIFAFFSNDMTEKCFSVLSNLYFYCNKHLGLTKPSLFELESSKLNRLYNQPSLFFKFSSKKKDFICIPPDQHIKKLKLIFEFFHSSSPSKNSSSSSSSYSSQTIAANKRVTVSLIDQEGVTRKFNKFNFFILKYFLLLGGINSVCTDDLKLMQSCKQQLNHSQVIKSVLEKEKKKKLYELINNNVSLYQKFITLNPIRFSIDFRIFGNISNSFSDQTRQIEHQKHHQQETPKNSSKGRDTIKEEILEEIRKGKIKQEKSPKSPKFLKKEKKMTGKKMRFGLQMFGSDGEIEGNSSSSFIFNEPVLDSSKINDFEGIGDPEIFEKLVKEIENDFFSKFTKLGRKNHNEIKENERTEFSVLFSGKLFFPIKENTILQQLLQSSFHEEQQDQQTSQSTITESGTGQTGINLQEIIFSIIQRRNRNKFSVFIYIFRRKKSFLYKLKKYKPENLKKIKFFDQKKRIKLFTTDKKYITYYLINLSVYKSLKIAIESIWSSVNPFVLENERLGPIQVNTNDFQDICSIKGKFKQYSLFCNYGLDFFGCINSSFSLKLIKYLHFFHDVQRIKFSDSIDYEKDRKLHRNCILICTDFAFFVVEVSPLTNFGKFNQIQVIDRNKFSDVLNFFYSKNSKKLKIFSRNNEYGKFKFLMKSGEKVVIQMNNNSHPFEFIKILKEEYNLESSRSFKIKIGKNVIQRRNSTRTIKDNNSSNILVFKLLKGLEKEDVSLVSNVWYKQYEFMNKKKVVRPIMIAFLRLVTSRKEKLKILRELKKVKRMEQLKEIQKRIFYYSPLTQMDFFTCFYEYLKVFHSIHKIIPAIAIDDPSFLEFFDWILLSSQKTNTYQTIESSTSK